MTIEEKTPGQLRDAEIARQALELGARHLESQTANSLYMQAWKKAAQMLRAIRLD